MKQTADFEAPDASLLNEEEAVAKQVVLAHIKDFDAEKRPVVSFIVATKSHSYSAMTTEVLDQRHLSRQVALSFINGDLTKPIILGLVYSPLLEYLENVEISPEATEQPNGTTSTQREQNETVTVDGKRVLIDAQDAIELRCGEASITLTKTGKIVIKGKYLLNRSSGVNRIIGGSVQVN